MIIFDSATYNDATFTELLFWKPVYFRYLPDMYKIILPWEVWASS
jgi:hypothetical protein